MGRKQIDPQAKATQVSVSLPLKILETVDAVRMTGFGGMCVTRSALIQYALIEYLATKEL